MTPTPSPSPVPASTATPVEDKLRSALRLVGRGLRWFFSNRGFQSIPVTKDIDRHPMFRGGISRGTWRFFMLRLTPASRWFLLPTVIFMTYGSSSLQLQAYVPFCYALGLWATGFLGVLFCKPRVKLRISHAERIREGETLPIDIEIEQLRSLSAAELNVIPYGLPPDMDAESDEGISVPSLAVGETARLRLNLLCKKRGNQRWKGYRVSTDFPFGLISAYRIFASAHPLLVHPNYTPLARMEIPIGRRYQPGGVALASKLGESFEFLGDREFRHGDNIRDIDWRATARLNQPIVREYREEYFQRVAVVLDTHLPRGAKSRRMEDFERGISICAAVSDFMSRQDYIVDLFAAGPDLYHLTSGRSLAYLEQILDILACVEPTPLEPFDILEPEIQENLAQITAVICIFLDWNEARRDFVHNLSREGTGLKIVIVRDGPCTLDPNADAVLGPIPVISAERFAAGVEEF